MTPVGLARGVIAFVGFSYVAAAVALLVAPEWFYGALGEFPPFNRHYMGDAGAFLLGIGIALLVAAQEPRRYLVLLYIGIAVSWLHAVNHLFDAVSHPGTGQAGLADTLVIVAPAIALTAATIVLARPTGLFERTGRRA